MRLVCLFVSLAASAVAQNSAPPSFDVASVKINPQFDPSNRATANASEEVRPGVISFHNFSLSMLVAWAYDIQRPQVAAPDWAEAVRYDVDAKAAGACEEAGMRRMLQTLLAERFHLATHRESKQQDAYLLLVAKSGLKMIPSQGNETRTHPDPRGGTAVEAVTVAEIAENFSHDLAAPVIDSTGLTGRFDAHFDPARYVADMREKVRGMPEVHEDELKVILIQNILEGELGLRVEPRRAAVEMLVIDHADKTPVEN